ncbi:MAG: DegV family EDD domain-containing protein, partial [Desulfatitalea sp.]|nr:DegV family EDD domain-containing protein [Desulfatitalea sp.]NNK01106.1 DegV family EDD domain-containing protein [Desulfatitalea sp.]
VNVTLTPHDRDAPVREWLAGAADSVVVTGPADQMNVHLHTTDRAALRVGLDTLGRVVNWSEARIVSTARRYDQGDQGVHIMTDAAGSLSLSDARQLGVTLLNSYLVVGEQSWPETLFDPERLYAVMVDGIKVSTAQASRYEKHESYLSAVSRFQRVLYLCVGSVYTGNYESAQRWKSENELGDRLSVIDTGAASGRLGLIVTATAEFAGQGADAQAVQCFAESTISQCRELVFLDQLKYLAAGGRVSKTKGFLGDLLRKKPIVSPTAHGAAKVGIVHNRDEQLAFALDRLDAQFPTDAAPRVLLQYADNRTWVQDIVAEQIHFRWPSANITVRPLSLTSGAHMGPGTWAMAYL